VNRNVFNHVGVCVTDLERSRRFYEALGFAFKRELRPPDGISAKLLGLQSPLGLTAVYLTLGTFTLELLHFDAPDTPPATPRVMNEPGLTHLSISAGDLSGTLERVRSLGCEVIDDTDIKVAVMIRDPDGQLIELLAGPMPD